MQMLHCWAEGLEDHGPVLDPVCQEVLQQHPLLRALQTTPGFLELVEVLARCVALGL